MKKGSIGLADQVVISGANFVFMIVAARELGPAAFGLFALLYTTLWLTQAVQSSFVSTPHTVISAGKNEVTYRTYTSSVALLQLVLALATGSVIAIASFVAFLVSPGVAPVFLALVLASVASLMQNFTRRVLYTESRFSAALVQDIVTQGLRMLLLGTLVLTGGLDASSLFLILGTACFVGSLVGTWQIRGALTFTFDRGVIREHWEFGNWLGASQIAALLPQYVTAALLSATLSVGAYGAYRAALQIVHGANVPLEALNSLLRPRLARDAQRGPAAVSRTIRPLLLFGGAALVVVAALLILLREPLLGLIYGSEYAPYASVLFLLALRPLLDLQKDVLSNALLAFRQTRAIFIRTVLGSLSGVGLGGITVLVFGLPAAGAITAFGGAASVLWLAWAWKRHSERETERSENQQVAQERLASQ